eukprot:scaffold111476_cov58-Cyclotella_meneghiniana.AAC.2
MTKWVHSRSKEEMKLMARDHLACWSPLSGHWSAIWNQSLGTDSAMTMVCWSLLVTTLDLRQENSLVTLMENSLVTLMETLLVTLM